MAVTFEKAGAVFRLAACAFIICIVLQSFFADGIKPYCSVKEYLYQNDFTDGQAEEIHDTAVSQHFVARGNIIISFLLYVNSADSGTVQITLSKADGSRIKSVPADLGSYTPGTWARIALDCKYLKRGAEYVLTIQSERGLHSLLLDQGEQPEIYLQCEGSRGRINGSLAAGIQQTYSYLTWAGVLELFFTLLMAVLLALALCYTVLHIKLLVSEFEASRMGLLYAVCFAVTLVFLFNPMDEARTQVQSFKRVIGAGMLSNVDVSRRISSFSCWFLFFGAACMLFYLLVCYFRRRECSGEKKKVRDFLDQLVILADVNLVFRCITYFADQTEMRTVFYYSTAVIQLGILAAGAYLILNLDKKISADLYARLEVSAFCIAFPVAVLVQKEWQSGKLLIGIQAAAVISVPVLSCVFAGFIKSEKSRALIDAGCVCAAGLPFVTSLYIELISILNQHGVFVSHLRKYYAVCMLAGFAFTLLFSVFIRKRRMILAKWKTWTYSWMVFGITCLSVQIPLEGTYHADIFEAANAGILISGFLDYGEIPLIEHYGGHMMSGVWEGLIYAVLNHDSKGAVFSPYAEYHTAVLAVLFFALVRKVWKEDLALFATLCFPFSGAWNYFGLGMTVCLAVWAYLKKNTYFRAALIWLAFIWCALYRLDLGFSIGSACMLAALVYILADRNWKAAKQLSITLAAWSVCGSALWFMLCVAKGIHPVHRMLEFLLISLSNQNWAFAGIGNTGNTIFSWCYLLVPFAMAGSLLYIVFSKEFRKNAGDEIWMLLLILGFSYFTNFSRGLVRHSLAEQAASVVLWNAYIYLAVFFSVYKKKKECFLPVFALLMLCNTVLTVPANYQASAIGDQAASKLGQFTEKWTPGRFAYEDLKTDENGEKEIPQTYWEKLQTDQKKVSRTVWDETLRDTVQPYALVMDTLLEKDETFADFINKTFAYALMNRRNPFYVSQSPLQLSGEFTQEMFIAQMKGIPLVLMPLDEYRAAVRLDGIANAYRYYKVSEYISRSYVPLCRYGTSFAVWCLPQRYAEFRQKIKPLTGRTDYTMAFQTSGQLEFENCSRRTDPASGDTVITAGKDSPAVRGLQNLINPAPYEGKNVCIEIAYDTDTDGQMQIFYSDADGGEHSAGETAATASISGDGTAEFLVPVTEGTQLKLDIPAGSTVRIKSLRAGCPVFYIDYGYDGPDESEDKEGNVASIYRNSLHTYSLAYLPAIWAEHDDAASHTVCCSLRDQDGIYVFDRKKIAADADQKGNYLLITADYTGTDTGEDYDADDETIDAVVRAGIYKNGTFIEKYQYTMTVKEGRHDYLIRISNDYYWYLGEVNAVTVSCEGDLREVGMKMLEGD